MRRASAGQTASFTLVTDPDTDSDGDEDQEGDGGLVAVHQGVAVSPEGAHSAAAAEAPQEKAIHGGGGGIEKEKEEEEKKAVEAAVGVVVSTPARTGGDSGGMGMMASRGTSPPLFDGGSGGGGVGEAESPSRRTRKGMVLVEVGDYMSYTLWEGRGVRMSVFLRLFCFCEAGLLRPGCKVMISRRGGGGVRARAPLCYGLGGVGCCVIHDCWFLLKEHCSCCLLRAPMLPQTMPELAGDLAR